MFNLENAASFFSEWEIELQDCLEAFENNAYEKLDRDIVSWKNCRNYVRSAKEIQKNPKAPEKLKAQAARIEKLAMKVFGKSVQNFFSEQF